MYMIVSVQHRQLFSVTIIEYSIERSPEVVVGPFWSVSTRIKICIFLSIEIEALSCSQQGRRKVRNELCLIVDSDSDFTPPFALVHA